MARLAHQYSTGLVVEPTADALVQTLLNLSDDAVDRMKQASLAAARELCWERERERLLAVYDSLLPQAACAGAAHAAGRTGESIPHRLSAG
jgi:hypothetical protein